MTLFNTVRIQEMKSLKRGYDRHWVATMVVLVALPIILGSSTFVLINEPYTNQFITFLGQILDDVQIGFEFLQSLILLQYVIVIMMLILYPIYPHIFSLENHLSKRNAKSALSEYETLRRIVYALLPLFFFTVALAISIRVFPQNNPLAALVQSLDPFSQSLLLSILIAIFFTVGSALLRIILLNTSIYFKFYLARLSFRALSGENDNTKRIKYLIKGLSYYNEFIRRTLGLQINNLKVIYSKVILGTVSKDRSVKELCLTFEDNDKLKPIRFLTEFFDIKDPEYFLAKESIGKKLEQWISILGAFVSIIATIIGTVVTLIGTQAQVPSPS